MWESPIYKFKTQIDGKKGTYSLMLQGLKFQPDLIIYGFYLGNDVTHIAQQYWVELDGRNLPTKIVNDRIYVDDFGRIRSSVLTWSYDWSDHWQPVPDFLISTSQSATIPYTIPSDIGSGTMS